MWFLVAVAVLALVLLVRWRRSSLSATTFVLLGLFKWYACFWQRVRPGVSTFPREGPALVVVNHTCSADASFLLRDAKRILSFITTHQHYDLSRPTRWVLRHAGCVPVERTGHDPAGVRASLRCLKEGRILVVFPEGNLSGVALGRMRRWKYGAAYLALRSGVPVYPAWIDGGPRTDSLLRAWLGRSGKQVRVCYGTPVDLSLYRGRRISRALLEEVTEVLMRRVADLQPKNGEFAPRIPRRP